MDWFSGHNVYSHNAVGQQFHQVHEEASDDDLYIRPRLTGHASPADMMEEYVRAHAGDNQRFEYLNEDNGLHERGKKKVRKYSLDDLDKAVRCVNTGRASLRKASQEFNIPKSTIEDHIKERYPLKERGPARCITDIEEVALVEYITYMSDHGFPPRRCDVRIMIKEIVERTGRPSPFNDEKGPSDNWFRGFLSRHPQLSEKIPQTREAARSRMSNEVIIDGYFELYNDTVTKLQVIPAAIFNCDETGFTSKQKTREKAFGIRGRPSYQDQVISVDHVTAHMCVSAGGRVLPTLVIFQKSLPMRTSADECPSDWSFAVSESESLLGHSIDVKSEAFFEEGERLMKEGQYNEAVKAFTKYLQCAVKIQCNGKDLGVGFYKRSHAYFMMKNYEKAANDAETSIRCWPIGALSAYRLAEALEGLGKYDLAFELCIRALKIYILDLEPETEYLKLSSRLASKVSGGFEVLSLNEYRQEAWSSVVRLLSAEGAWSTVRIILMGTDDVTALAPTCDAHGVDLSGLLQSCSQTMWTQWGQKLSLLLLKHGADYTSLCRDRKYPFHEALRTALKTESFDLLKYILANHKGDKDKMLDIEGNSLLHEACRSKSSSKTTAVRLLLNNDIDPNLTNKQGEKALGLLNPQAPEYDILMNKMKASKPASRREKASTEKASSVPHKGSGDASTTKPPSGSSKTYDHLKGWSKTKIQKWLEGNLLSQHKKKFRDLDGSLLVELRLMQDSAPEMFYRVLEETLHLPLVDLLRLAAAMRQI